MRRASTEDMSSRHFPLFLTKLRLFVFLLLFAGLSAQAGAPACRSFFTASTNGIAFAPTLLKISGHFEFENFQFDGTLSTLARSQEYKRLLERASASPVHIYGLVSLSETSGGGALRLTKLDLADGNLAYNHLELVTLLKVNPELAHRIGFFEVPGYENLAWVPDLTQINYRLQLIAKEQGFDSAVWNYAQADGVVEFEPYIKMLSQGHFPFSNDSDMNLAVHDAMHAAAFSALNSTPNSRKVMGASLKRSENVYKLYKTIKTDFPEVLHSFVKHSGLLVSGGLEKTMLLSIILTGNYNYFSASNRRAEGNLNELQNKQITILRVQRLMKLYANGNVSFKKFYSLLSKSSLSRERLKKLSALFKEAIDQLEVTSETTVKKAAIEIVEKFLHTNLLSRTAAVRARQLDADFDIDTIYPERALDMRVSDGEVAMR